MVATSSDTNSIRKNLETIINNIAYKMTNTIRQQGTARPAQGTTWNFVTVFHIRWSQMVFPTLLIVLSAVILVLTIVQTAGTTTLPPWRSSILPLLFHVIKTVPNHRSEHLTDLEYTALHTKAKLQKTNNAQFVVHEERIESQ